MIYHIHLVKGIFAPERNRYHLHKAEAVTHLKRKIVLLYVFSILIFGLYGFLGIGSESFSKEVLYLNRGEFEIGKLLILVGKLFAGFIYPTVYLFLISLFLWVLTDIAYLKILIVQMIVFILQLFEKVLLVPFYVFLHINQDANPFSLGVISQYFMSSEYAIHLFSEVTVFQILVIAFEYYYFKYFTEKSKSIILSSIVISYMVLWLVQAMLSYLKVSVFV